MNADGTKVFGYVNGEACVWDLSTGKLLSS